MYIDRHIAKVIERQQKKKKVIILTGPRQAGKSTLLKTMLNPMGVVYLSLDNPAVRENALENPSRFLEMNKPPIIIDEIQKAPLLFEYIKEIVDGSDKTGQYYLSGSQSFRLMKGVTESLAGRAGIVNMLGLSLREISGIGYSGGIEEIIHKGSFPALYETEHDLKPA